MSAYTGWAIVEVMGHRRHVGLVSEVTRFGVTMCRIEAVVGHDIDVREPIEYAGSALFSVREITEEQARLAVAPPAWAQVTQQLPPPNVAEEDLGDDEEPDSVDPSELGASDNTGHADPSKFLSPASPPIEEDAVLWSAL